MKDSKTSGSETKLEKRKAILAALAKATAEDSSSSLNTIPDADDSDDYYTLTPAEMVALVNGDMEKIESWVSNLDRRHATLLLRWLIKENR